MKHKLLIMGILVLGWVMFASVPAEALTITGSGYSSYMPSWNQTLPYYSRFVVLINMNYKAVWDKETGLVWEKSPSTDQKTWNDAIAYCYNLNLGGRGGFRLPTVEELRTLVDPNNSDPALPSGHPFDNVKSQEYWSAATVAGNTWLAWVVFFYDGSVDNGDKTVSTGRRAWCVRGAHGYDGQ